MGLLSDVLNFFKRPPGKTEYAEVLSGHAPIFSQFGDSIYASDVVQQAIGCIVSELKKLRPEHVKEIGNDITPVPGSLQKVLENPNPLMTQSEFIEKMGWMLYLNYNAFAIPVYHEWTAKDGTVKRKYEAIYPILPSQVDFIQDASGRYYVQFRFANGKKFDPIPYDEVIHLKLHYGVNQFMGGNAQGQPDNEALLKTLRLNHDLLQGVAKAMKASYAVNGVTKYNTMMDKEKTEKAIKEFEAAIQDSRSGILALDLKAEYIPIKKEISLVDDKTLRFIDEKILRHFGVSLPILTGDYTKGQYEAFYQKTLEPLVIGLSQAFTKTLITPGGKEFGNRIKFYPKEMIFMSVDQTIEMVTLLSNTGAMYENEKRAAFGLKPLKELEGKRFSSLNWIEADKAAEYQLNGQNKGGDNSE